MHFELPRSGRMRTRWVRKIGFADGSLAFEAKSYRGSASTSNSDSIEADVCAPLVPDGEGQRERQNAGSTGATIPCLRTPYSTQSFSFWNQPVAAISEDSLRQLKMRRACPEELGREMTTRSHFSASRPNGVLPGSLHTENALYEANPEV